MCIRDRPIPSISTEINILSDAFAHRKEHKLSNTTNFLIINPYQMEDDLKQYYHCS